MAAAKFLVLAPMLGGVCAVGAIADTVFLASGANPFTLTPSLGLAPGMVVGLDGLSGFFALIILSVATAACVAAGTMRGWVIALMAAFIVGMLLCLAAADTVSLLAGFELMSGASLALVLTGDVAPESRQAAVLYAGMAAFSALCLIGAVGVLGTDGMSFAAIRAHPPSSGRAAWVFALVLLGAGAKAGLVPLHGWLPAAHAAAPAPVSALMSGAMTKVALYVMARVLLDLTGPVQPVAWGSILMLVGAASAVLGATRAGMETDLKAILGCSTIENIGLMTVALGVALAARAADLPALSGLALGACLLHALAHGLFKPLLFLAAGAVQHQAGSRELDRLGGLIHGMPITTACVLVGGASLAALPPSAGFAGEWMVLQSVLAAPRVGGLAFQVITCVAAASLAFAVALAAAASVRLIGVAFLGRPRSPRGASAAEPAALLRGVLIGLAALAALLGLLPALALHLAAPALQAFSGVDPASSPPWLMLQAQQEGSAYVPLGLAVLLGVAAGSAVLLVRWRGARGALRAPAWECGFGPLPNWLPFGDPTAQASAPGQTQILRRTVAGFLLGARERATPQDIRWSSADPADWALLRPLARARDALSGWAERLQVLTARQALTVVFAVLVLMLVAVALAEQG